MNLNLHPTSPAAPHWFTGLLRCFAFAVLCLAPVPAAVSAQGAGLVIRYGVGSSADIADFALGPGVEAELYIKDTLVTSLRGDFWLFGFSCVGFGPCLDNVQTISIGARYRVVGEGPVSAYFGGDLGRAWWPGSVRGWTVRPRVGLDLRVLRYCELNGEVGFAWFSEPEATQHRLPTNGILGASAGVRLRL